MAGAIVSIAQQKGGAGKTTVAVQLGVAWLSAGRRVAMLDIDPQASLFTWFNVRRRRFGDLEDGLLVQGLSGWRLGSELRRLRGEFDLILVDSPPHAESDARAAVRESNLVLVPCQPNALDVWASAPTLELAQG
jgi:chromosome partitioning protein